MPGSHLYQLNEIMELIQFANPRTMLDVGVGFGKYGFLAREYLELWDGRERYYDWQRQIEGIEVFEDYLTPIHRLVYDKIYVGDALDILPTLNQNYDLVLLIDVLEHFDFNDGRSILQLCQKRGRNIIVSVPKDIGQQGTAFGNPHETHRFQWKEKHFAEFSSKFFVRNSYSLICFIGADSGQVRKGRKQERARLRRTSTVDLLHLRGPIRRLLRRTSRSEKLPTDNHESDAMPPHSPRE